MVYMAHPQNKQGKDETKNLCIIMEEFGSYRFHMFVANLIIYFTATKSVKHTTSATDQEPEPAHVEQPKKAFHAAPEQKFTCPFKNCNKSFRKKSLVEYHVKYYHTEDGNVVQAQPPRKRRKTSSICTSIRE